MIRSYYRLLRRPLFWNGFGVYYFFLFLSYYIIPSPLGIDSPNFRGSRMVGSNRTMFLQFSKFCRGDSSELKSAPKMARLWTAFNMGVRTLHLQLCPPTKWWPQIRQGTFVKEVIGPEMEMDDLSRLILVHCSCRIGGSALARVVSFLTGRTEQVCYNGHLSAISFLIFGVPHGSSCGPLLHLCTIFGRGVRRDCRLWARRSLIRWWYTDLGQRSGHQCNSRNAASYSLHRTYRKVDGQKPAQVEPEQDADHLDRNMSAIGQGKRHRVNPSIWPLSVFWRLFLILASSSTRNSYSTYFVDVVRVRNSYLLIYVAQVFRSWYFQLR